MSAWESHEIATLFEMARLGLGIEAIALDIKRTQKDIREMATAFGLSLEKLEYPEICPRCGYGLVLGDEDFCPKCLMEKKHERMEADEADEAHRLREAEKRDATLRKQRERRREKVGTNPRKGPDAALMRQLRKDGCFDEEEED